MEKLVELQILFPDREQPRRRDRGGDRDRDRGERRDFLVEHLIFSVPTLSQLMIDDNI